MGLFDINWNLANFFGLPILIGAGHEYGVFLVHRYREAAADPRRFWKRRDASDRALLLCALITCSSFGFFWALGHHRGLRSLGLVMWLGIACIYLAAVLALRPLLLWMLSRQSLARTPPGADPFSRSDTPRLSSRTESPREATHP
jgi:predicted RND superfamily exporter protein